MVMDGDTDPFRPAISTGGDSGGCIAAIDRHPEFTRVPEDGGLSRHQGDGRGGEGDDAVRVRDVSSTGLF